LRKWLWLIVLGTVLAGGVALAFSFSSPPVYDAEVDIASVKSYTQLSLSPGFQTVSEAQAQNLYTVDPTERQKALLELARSSEVATAVIAQLGPNFDSEGLNVADLVEKVNVKTNGDLIQITVQHEDPKKAAQIASVWGDAFAKLVNQLYTESPTSQDQIQGQVSQAWQSYQSAEAAVVQLVGANQVDTLKREIEAKQNTLSDLYASQRQLDLFLQDARSLQDLVSKDPSVSSFDAGNRLALLMIQAKAATIAAPPAAPLQLQVTTGSLNDTPATGIRSQIDALVASAQVRQQQVQAKLKDPVLPQQILAMQKELEDQNAKMLQLTSARDLAWTVYTGLVSKAQELEITAHSGGTIVRVAGPVVEPTIPVGSRKILIILLAALIGCMISLGIAFLLEFVDPSIWSPRQAEDQLALPIYQIATEPVRSDAAGAQGSILGWSPEFQRLWATLSLSSKPVGKTLLLTFADDAAGTASQSTAHGSNSRNRVATNLAIAASQSGRSVILVDANVYAPTLHQTFGVSNSRGWSNLLEDETSNLAACLQSTSFKNLRVVTSGTGPARGPESASSPRLARVIELLSAEADLVILAGAPLQAGADSLWLAKEVEGVLLLVMVGLTRREEAIRVKEQMQSMRANLLGVILVQTESAYGLLGRLTKKARKPEAGAASPAPEALR
jgi:uncharacterized protein involved in exopolysaccharide biosynthesis